MRVLIKVLLPGCLLLTLATAAAAQSVCDGQTGAAHGLCTAYCEAMDCDGASPQASQTACAKVKANFAEITGQNPPCDNACPCAAIPGFLALLNGQSGSLVSCQEEFGPGADFWVVSTANDSVVAGLAQGVPGTGLECELGRFGAGAGLRRTSSAG